MLGSFRREREAGRGFEGLPRPENRGRKTWAIDRVGVMLCLQAEPAVFKMIAGVELHTRLRGPDFHDTSAPRLAGARSQHEGSAVAVQNKVVVIAAWFWLELIDARAKIGRAHV